MNIGIITYAYPHLKTEQILLCLLNKSFSPQNITVFALPFKKRKEREVFFSHRPAQEKAISPITLCEAYNIKYLECHSDIEITNECDIYLVTGSGILSEEMLWGKKVINAHPGIIPAARGLDSFKWSILNSVPLGITLHYIDKNVDMGEIISIIPTPIFMSDTLDSLARRHYENEIAVLSSFDYHLNHPHNEFVSIDSKEATKRMPFEIEKKIEKLFEEYKKKYAIKFVI